MVNNNVAPPSIPGDVDRKMTREYQKGKAIRKGHVVCELSLTIKQHSVTWFNNLTPIAYHVTLLK